jgi:hypothetical protein
MVSTLGKIFLLISLIVLLGPSTGCIYHKPVFQGKIIDVDTKEPMEGAVVVAFYEKLSMGLGAGANEVIINARETLTNKNGQFRIPSYTTLIIPIINRDSSTTFIIFKPGYGSVARMNLEEYLSKETGKKAEFPLFYDSPTKKIRLSSGVVELPKINTREELIKRMLGFPTGYSAKELPLLYKAYDDEKYIFEKK